MVIENVIVIPTHVSGLKYLENLLQSFQGFDKYPILIVVSGYREKDWKRFSEIKQKFNRLPISIITAQGDYFTFGGVFMAYHYTNYENIFVLPNSCEIVNPALFDIVFEQHKNKSVAFALMDAGEVKGFWHSEIGKFRRPILDKMDLSAYLPRDVLEAMMKGEMSFTIQYHSLDQNTVVLFPDWVDGNVFEEKFGQRRMKIANEYIIKWKGHWDLDTVLAHVKKNSLPRYLFHKFKPGGFFWS
jgi:hypothetical protein